MKTLAYLLLCVGLHAKQLFVAPTGSDANPGTLEQPLASLVKAQTLTAPGDTVWIRGGTYKLTEAQVARRQRVWVYVQYFDQSGQPDAPIRYWAYQDEKPVFDLTEIKPADRRINAFQVTGSWLHFRGFEVIGTQVNFKGHGQSCNIENHGSHNIFERLNLHDSQAVGIYALSGAHNLFLNCDAYRNHDFTSEDGKGGNVDGFGCHPSAGSIDNIFRGCRAWFNSDDGYDCISSFESVRFENCWAMYNGYGQKFEKLGDGNGFKVGGYGNAPAHGTPNKVPRHTTENCLAVRNRANGFYANHHLIGGDWRHNTAYGNSTNFNFLMRAPDNTHEIDGMGQVLVGNLGYLGRTLTHLNRQANAPDNDAFYFAKSAEEFTSLDEAQLTAPRQADGSLPVLTFMKLKSADKQAEFGAGK